MVDAGRPDKFTLDDFRRLLGQARRSGTPGRPAVSLPGVSTAEAIVEQHAQEHLGRVQGSIDSMTPEERRNPKGMIDQSRRRRIAAGAGVEPHEVNELVKQFEPMADMMKKMSGMGIRDRMRTMQQLTEGGMLDPGGRLAKQKKGSGKRLSPKERAKQRKLREKEFRRRKREGKKNRK